MQATGDVVHAQPRRILPWVLAGVVLTGVTVGLAVWSVMGPAPPRLARFAISEPPNVNLNTGSTPTVTISPDGTRIVYVGPEHQLYVRAVDQLAAVELRGGVGINPFISPDGNWVGFLGQDDALKKVSIHGGPPVVLTEGMGGIMGASWGTDDSIIFGTWQRNGLFRVSAAGGQEREPITTLEEGESDHHWPEILPGGRTVLFTVDNGQEEIAALDLETGERKLLIPGGSNPHYAATGHIVYGVDGTLRAVPFDLDAVEVKGDPIPVLEGVVTRVGGDAHFSLAKDGTLVYVPGTGHVGQQMTFVWVDRDGREEAVAAPPRGYVYPRISPDGGRVVLDVRDEQDDIVIWDLTREILTRFTPTQANESYPAWTPDGARIAYFEGGSRILWKAADGSGVAEEILGEAGEPYFFSPTGQELVFRHRTSGGEDIGMISLDGDAEVQSLLSAEFTERNAELSPDGSWMAYQSNESGEFEIYVKPFPNVNEGQHQVSNAGGEQPLWSRNGKELLYLEPGPSVRLMSVPVRAGEVLELGSSQAVMDWPYLFPGPGGRTYDVSPDGSRFIALDPVVSDSEVLRPQINIVLNWFEELKRLAPTNN